MLTEYYRNKWGRKIIRHWIKTGEFDLDALKDFVINSCGITEEEIEGWRKEIKEDKKKKERRYE